MSNGTRRVLIVLAVMLVVLPAVLIVGGVLMLQSERTERWVEARIADAISRDVEVEGIDFQFGWPPAINVERLRIANPQWAKTPDLIDATDLHARIEVLPLLRKLIVIPYFSARKVVAGLEQDGDRATWRFGDGGEEQPSPFVIKRVNVEDGSIHYRNANDNTALDVTVKGSLGEGGELNVTAKGKVKGENAKGTARIPSLQPSPDTPIEIEARASVGRTNVSAQGSFAADLTSIDMRVRVAGPTLRALDKVSGIKLPDTPPYSVSGQLRHTGEEWQFQSLEGKIGDSDVRGDVSYRAGGKRPFLQADLKSKLLDLDDLGPLIGAPPKTGPGETASDEQKAKAQAQKEKGTVLPREPFNTAAWTALDAEVTLEAQRVMRPKQVPIDKLATRVVLENALLRLEPLSFTVADGNVKGSIALDARKDPLAASMDLDIQGIKLSRIFPEKGGLQPSLGTLYGRGKLSGHGVSVGEMLGTSNGQLSLAVDGGQVNLLLVELLGLDLAEASALLGARKRDKVELRCAVADFSVNDGVANPDVFVVDTVDTVVNVTGTVNFEEEEFNIVTYPEPKDMSLFSLRSPVQMQGAFKDPKIRPKAGPIAARGAAAAALAAVNPLLALLPFIETGPGKDSDCGALLAHAKQKGAVKKQE
jgi:AsmA family protein